MRQLSVSNQTCYQNHYTLTLFVILLSLSNSHVNSDTHWNTNETLNRISMFYQTMNHDDNPYDMISVMRFGTNIKHMNTINFQFQQNSGKTCSRVLPIKTVFSHVEYLSKSKYFAQEKV